MIGRQIKERDRPITSEDLAICQRVLDAVKEEFHLNADDEETTRGAAITIELYRQGVHDFDQLKALVLAARGKIVE